MQKPNSQLTSEEREKIEILIKEGMSCAEIGREIGRGKNSIVVEIRRNGGREVYNAKQAHKNALIRKNDKILAMQKKNMVESPYKTIRKRLNYLEIQMDILTDTIKQLKEDYENTKD